MEKAKIPFGGGAAPALEELGGASPINVNLLKEGGTNWFRLTPGTSAWDWFPATPPEASPVIGIQDWNGMLVYVTQNVTTGIRRVWGISAPGLAFAGSGAQLEGDQLPIFAVERSRLFIAGGGRILYWNGVGGTATNMAGPQDSGASLPVSFILANNGALLAPIRGDKQARFKWSGGPAIFGEAAEIIAWDELQNFHSAGARADQILAAGENSNEVFMFGSETVEAFRPASAQTSNPAVTVLDYTRQAGINVGIVAPYSLINLLDHGSFCWLTPKREIVVSNGRGDPQRISDPQLTGVLRSLSVVSDCRGWRWEIDSHDLLVLSFPTEGRTFAYCMKTEFWTELRGFDVTTGNWAPLPITSYFFWADQNVHLVGLADGTIVKLDNASATFAGQPVVGETVTGFMNHGTETPKQTMKFKLPMRRGFDETAPSVDLRYRDNQGPYNNIVPLSTGGLTDNRPFVEKRLVSRAYVRREWGLRMSGSAGYSFGQGEETYETLEE